MLWLPGMDEKPFSIAAPVRSCSPSPASGLSARRSTCWSPVTRCGCAARSAEAGPLRPPDAPGGRRLRGGAARLPRPALLGQGATVEAALGARTAADLLFQARFAGIGVPVHAATEDGSAARAAGSPTWCSPCSPPGSSSGRAPADPKGCLQASTLSAPAGVPAELSYEAYMRCGVGICGACEHEGRLVCLDGPVMRAAPGAGRTARPFFPRTGSPSSARIRARHGDGGPDQRATSW